MTMTKVRGPTVLGADKKQAKRQKGWRIDAALADYVEEQAKARGGARGAEVDAIEDCIRIHRALNEILSGQKPRLERYAIKNALSLRDHETAVLARLVLAGLDASETQRK